MGEVDYSVGFGETLKKRSTNRGGLMKRTYIDASVLTAALQGQASVAQRALQVLDDTVELQRKSGQLVSCSQALSG